MLPCIYLIQACNLMTSSPGVFSAPQPQTFANAVPHAANGGRLTEVSQYMNRKDNRTKTTARTKYSAQLQNITREKHIENYRTS